jgi:alpha-ketoglutarate-dependent taurine dioxygenase
MPRTIIDSPAAWRGPDMARRTDWIHRFTEDEIAEIDAAYRAARARGVPLAEITRADFPAPQFAELCEHVRDYLENGPGIFLLRGFPIERYEHAAQRAIYWGMGTHLGTAVTQSSDGDLLGDVRDASFDINSRTGRGYRSSQELTFHCDSADVTALFVLRNAKSGGISRFASSLEAHNEMARRDPDLLDVMFEPFYWSLQGQEAPGELPYYQQPIFHMQDGFFSSRYIKTQVHFAEKFAGAPPLTDRQCKALALFDSITDEPDFGFEMMLNPGDLEILNNHTAMHARTEFEDHPEPGRYRHLLRLWLSMPNSRPLSPLMNFIYRDQRPGAVRGGFRAHGARRVHETPL